MRYLAIAALLVLGCAHQTIHEYCTDNAPKYRDYDQCYAECSASGTCTNRGRKALGAMFSGTGKGLQNASSTAPKQCVSTVNGQTVYTTCN